MSSEGPSSEGATFFIRTWYQATTKAEHSRPVFDALEGFARRTAVLNDLCQHGSHVAGVLCADAVRCWMGWAFDVQPTGTFVPQLRDAVLHQLAVVSEPKPRLLSVLGVTWFYAHLRHGYLAAMQRALNAADLEAVDYGIHPVGSVPIAELGTPDQHRQLGQWLTPNIARLVTTPLQLRPLSCLEIVFYWTQREQWAQYSVLEMVQQLQGLTGSTAASRLCRKAAEDQVLVAAARELTANGLCEDGKLQVARVAAVIEDWRAAHLQAPDQVPDPLLAITQQFIDGGQPRPARVVFFLAAIPTFTRMIDFVSNPQLLQQCQLTDYLVQTEVDPTDFQLMPFTRELPRDQPLAAVHAAVLDAVERGNNQVQPFADALSTAYRQLLAGRPATAEPVVRGAVRMALVLICKISRPLSGAMSA